MTLDPYGAPTLLTARSPTSFVVPDLDPNLVRELDTPTIPLRRPADDEEEELDVDAGFAEDVADAFADDLTAAGLEVA